jgi:hemin uptake protein HemP
MGLLNQDDFIRSKVEGGGGGSTTPPKPRVVETQDLLGPLRELVIVHKGERYRLRITSKDRLILTK